MGFVIATEKTILLMAIILGLKLYIFFTLVQVLTNYLFFLSPFYHRFFTKMQVKLNLTKNIIE